VLGDDTLRTIARELVATVHSNVTIDWTVREECLCTDACACEEDIALPDKQEKATQTVLIQAEVLSQEWVAVG